MPKHEVDAFMFCKKKNRTFCVIIFRGRRNDSRKDFGRIKRGGKGNFSGGIKTVGGGRTFVFQLEAQFVNGI